MPFLNPLFLLALAASAVPVALHLLNRRNPKQFQFSTLRFLQMAIAKTRKSRQITQLLVLLMRMAIIALLALAFAQPRLRSSSWLPDGPRTIVIVIDGSASMRCRGPKLSNYDRAREWALGLLAEARDPDKAAVVITGRSKSDVIFPAISNHGLVAKAITDTPCGYGGADTVADLRRVVEKTIESHGDESMEIHFFSDFQSSTWKAQDLAAIGEKVRDLGIRLFLNRVEVAAAGNAWIRDVTMHPSAILGQGLVSARVRIGSDDEYVGTSVLRLSVQGNELAQRGVSLGSGASEEESLSARFDVDGDFALGRVTLDSDPLNEDNVRFFALERRDQIHVLLVNGSKSNRPDGADTFYLQRALNPRSLPSPLIAGKVIEWTQLDATDLSQFQMVLIANPPTIPAALALKLELYAGNGGNLVLYPGRNAGFEQTLKRFQSLAGLTAQQQAFRKTVKFKTTRSGTAMAVERDILSILPSPPTLNGNQRLLLRHRDSTLVNCLEMDTGSGLMVMAPRGRGEIWIAALAATRDWSDWPMHPSFVILHQLLARRTLGRRARTVAADVGGTAQLPWAGRELELKVEIAGPQGSRRRQTLKRRTAAQDFVLSVFRTPGHYRVTIAAPQPEIRYVTANVPIHESALATVSPDEIEAQFAGAKVYQPASFEKQKDILANMTHGHALWPYLLLLAFLLGIVEEIFANIRSWSKAAPDALKHLMKVRKA